MPRLVAFGNMAITVSRLRGAVQHCHRNTLTSRLRRFEAFGIVDRAVHAEVPPRVEYKLTPLGESLRTVLEAMATWALTVPRSRVAAAHGALSVKSK
jgi:DNA-binding HxlR family transcriptional regulator